ncbi:MAG: hypothetical protein K5681_00505 [Treponema sp.]|nr:hypothetical protein [Treponema sp.]
MKRKLFFNIGILAIAALVIFSLTVSSCNFKFGDPSLITEPTVDYSSSILTISIPRQSKSTKYINIYRQDVTDLSATSYDDADILSLGLIFPENLTSGGSTYQFQDTMVCKNHKYRYSVRYCEKSGYYYSDWSSAITIEDTAQAYDESITEEELSYTASGATFTYDDSDYTFTLVGTVTAPSAVTSFTDYYDPALLVSNEDTSCVFKLPSTVVSKISSGSSDNVTFSIKNILTEDFLGCDIEICGILGQHKEYNESEDDTSTSSSTEESEEDEEEDPIMRIMWTKPVEITVTGYNDNIINIPVGTATDAFDYSRSAAQSSSQY